MFSTNKIKLLNYLVFSGVNDVYFRVSILYLGVFFSLFCTCNVLMSNVKKKRAWWPHKMLISNFTDFLYSIGYKKIYLLLVLGQLQIELLPAQLFVLLSVIL